MEILVVVDNETDTLSSVDEGVPQVPEVIHLAARTPPGRRYKGHNCKTVFDQLCCRCHGLSVLITGRRGGQQRCMLFDTGPDSRIWLDNARRLGIDLSTIECVFLSHWHFDHSGAFPEVIAAISAARAVAGLSQPVIDLHPNRPDQRGLLLPSGVILLLPQQPTLDALALAGGEILTRDNPHPICDGFFFGSGAIDRVTDLAKMVTGNRPLHRPTLRFPSLTATRRTPRMGAAADTREKEESRLGVVVGFGLINAVLGTCLVFISARSPLPGSCLNVHCRQCVLNAAAK